MGTLKVKQKSWPDRDINRNYSSKSDSAAAAAAAEGTSLARSAPPTVNELRNNQPEPAPSVEFRAAALAILAQLAIV